MATSIQRPRGGASEAAPAMIRQLSVWVPNRPHRALEWAEAPDAGEMIRWIDLDVRAFELADEDRASVAEELTEVLRPACTDALSAAMLADLLNIADQREG